MVTLNELLGLEPNRVSAYDETARNRIAPSPTPFYYSERVLIGPGTKAYAVQFVQKRLVELCYLPEDTVIDGNCGTKTVLAIKKFQELSGLTVDGYAGEQTQARLFSENAVRNSMGFAYLDVIEQTEEVE